MHFHLCTWMYQSLRLYIGSCSRAPAYTFGEVIVSHTHPKVVQDQGRVQLDCCLPAWLGTHIDMHAVQYLHRSASPDTHYSAGDIIVILSESWPVKLDYERVILHYLTLRNVLLPGEYNSLVSLNVILSYIRSRLRTWHCFTVKLLTVAVTEGQCRSTWHWFC